MNNPPELLTKSEAAELLRIKPRTLAEWIRRCRIPYYKLPSGAIRFRKDSLLEYSNDRPFAHDGKNRAHTRREGKPAHAGKHGAASVSHCRGGRRHAGRTIGGSRPLAMASAISRGGLCGPWKAHAAHRCLYVDGEMPAESLYQRIAGMDGSGETLRVLNHEALFHRSNKVLNLADGATQDQLTRWMVPLARSQGNWAYLPERFPKWRTRPLRLAG